MYIGFGIVLYAIVMLLRFYRCQDLQNPKLENQRKIFIRGLSKQYGFTSQEFLVDRGNGWGFSVEWPAHLPLVGVGVCQCGIRARSIQ